MAKMALIVGIARYADSRLDLPAVRQDLPRIEQILTNFGIANFIPPLIDDDATLENITGSLEAMIEAAAPDDVCVFYFSGHGTHLEKSKTAAIVTWNADQNSLLTAMWLSAFLGRASARGISFWGIYDCCHSGGLPVLLELLFGPQRGVKYAPFSRLRKCPTAKCESQPGLHHQTPLSLVTSTLLRNSFHFAATGAGLPAFFADLDGDKNDESLFTYELARIIAVGQNIATFGDLVSDAVIKVQPEQDPQIVFPLGLEGRHLFS